MKPIKKNFTDESMRPVAVLIDYQDWQAIEKILESYQQQDTTIALADYAGVIQITVDPLDYQQQMRGKVQGVEKFNASDYSENNPGILEEAF